ncbi:MAG: exopolysaccharide biosynthesis polyprenyl glycosylphosphotransferase [Cyanobacteria bacterium J06634_6]
MTANKTPSQIRRLSGRYQKYYSSFSKSSLSLLRYFRVKGRRKFTDTQAHSEQWLLLGFGQQQQTYLDDLRALKLTRNAVFLLDTEQATSAAYRHHKIDQLSALESWLTQPWTGILVSSHLRLSTAHYQLLEAARSQGTSVLTTSEFYENRLHKLPADTLPKSGITLSTGFQLLTSQLGQRIKRFGDVLLASLILLLVAPIMLLTAILIKLDSPGPVFYSQTRTGRNLQAFKVHKFRSMVQDAEKHGAQWAKTKDARITRVGQFIRLVRIDELPQLWNVLKGDMSMIGPRPERPEFDQQLVAEIPHYSARYAIKPGITGWAQVLYPYGASVEDAYQKLAYDLYYIKNYSPWLDIVIVLKTVGVVLLGKGR